MTNEHTEILNDVFCDVTEKLAFMFGEPSEKDELPPVDTECIEARMTFAGPMTGSLTMAVPVEMCPIIAANVLGMEPDDESVQARATDALTELLNVICGNILTAIAGEQPVFDLTVPTAHALSAEDWAKLLEDPDTLAFVLEDLPALLQLKLESLPT
ncbi:MAG: chemotaxis protein CheX [Candidatus Hydrogenedentes bacterium]|nr:chemotaxis protein CheX [Candidatus Hydrogenedentota bacterium]